MNEEILSRLERIDHKEYSCGFEFADSSTFDETARCFEERKILAKEIERLNKELQDTKEHLGEFLHEQEEENKKLKKLIIALWHNNSARILNKEQIDLLNNIVFGNDEEDLGSDKE